MLQSSGRLNNNGTVHKRSYIVPYVEAQQADSGGSKPALAIIDHFRGQTTSNVPNQLETNGVHVCFLPLNTTNLLWPMVIFLKRKFEAWYIKEPSKQLHANDIDTVELQSINLH